MIKTKSQAFFHSYAISISDFNIDKNMKKYFRIVAYSKPHRGKTFVAMMEGKKYPFYAF